MNVTKFFADKMTANLGFEPSDDQRAAFDLLSSFVTEREDCDLFVLNGYAGTGKTSAIAAFVKTLKQLHYKYVLLAPTGRAAKVLAGFAGDKAYTIHKRIYRQKSLTEAFGSFVLDIDNLSDTIFIVDEASLITIMSGSSGGVFGSGDLLDDLITFVRRGKHNSLILVGDRGQLPPVGLEESPALDLDYMSQYGQVMSASLRQVVRQAAKSGILHNATILRHAIEAGMEQNDLCQKPKMELEGFEDIIRIRGGELIETLSDNFDRYGLDNVVVLCRSNKRANRYNQGIRSSVLLREEQLNKGDKIMVVKNCYQFMEKIDDPDFFIANGDVARIEKISNYEERYGINFAQVRLCLPDYDDLELTVKVIMDTLHSESASLSNEQQQKLFEGVYTDYDNITQKRKRYMAVREDKYFNALQIKYASAITCHKSQGGQWKVVFIDNALWADDISVEDIKWLYTAMTRATEKVYLVNFDDSFFA